VSEECRRYDGQWREDVVRLCGGYGVKALAAINVVELAQILGREDELEKAEVTLTNIRRLVGIAPRPISISETLKAQQALTVLKTGVAEFDEMTPWGGLRRGLIYGFAGEFGAGKSMFAIQCSVKAAGGRDLHRDRGGAEHTAP